MARVPSTVSRRAHGTAPNHGARTRSLNHTEDTPSSSIRSVRAAMSSGVMGESWASRAVFQAPAGSLASTSARHAPSGPQTSSFVRPGVAGGGRAAVGRALRP
ncbi:hypothetical protein [Streptomyces sp. TRM68367]|uniref:hypothetical protein n=1 Tax=Streptomyces sp. TRM68367 TaxID=2758415 RepID=UPI00165B2DF8|nr:hypothetical protein [Streptomyces sp. TRM68367]MBC9729547.1 hypothetical protein [Streptomyces sp. TRM68367]